MTTGQRKIPGPKYKFLSQLSVEELESLLLLRADTEEMEVFLDAVAVALIECERRKPTGRIPNIEDAWKEFQIYYNTPEKLAQEDQKDGEGIDFILKKLDATLSEGRSPAKPRKTVYRILRSVAVIAISIVLTFAVMIGAQAAGLNVFSTLAQWTDETFRFVPNHVSDDNTIKNVLRAYGMPEDFAPSKIPSDLSIHESTTYENSRGKAIVAVYSGDESFLGIEIKKYYNSTEINDVEHEKDAKSVEKFISHGRDFFIFSNLDGITATWSDRNSYMINLWGTISIEEMKDVISSIGG